MNRKKQGPKKFSETHRLGAGTLQDPLIVWLMDRPGTMKYPGAAEAVEKIGREACQRANLPIIYIRSLPHIETSLRTVAGAISVETDAHVTVFMNKTCPEGKSESGNHVYFFPDFHFQGHVYVNVIPETFSPINMSSAAQRPITGPKDIRNPELWNIETGLKVPLPQW